LFDFYYARRTMEEAIFMFWGLRGVKQRLQRLRFVEIKTRRNVVKEINIPFYQNKLKKQ